MSEFYVNCEKSEILRLYSIVHVAMATPQMSHFICQSKSFITILIFPIAKFPLVSCILSLAMIWQMTYHTLCTHKLPKLCSATFGTSILLSH